MTINIHTVQFTDPEFEQCFQIRLTVFVEEQNVPIEEERDEYDATALHFLATDENTPLGTARVVFKNNGATAKIGRVAVLKSARKLGVGAALMRHIENTVTAEEFILTGQTQALPFYQRLGYTAYGDEFLENDIPHFLMRKRVKIS